MTNVGNTLLNYLYNENVRHIFGVPGDFVLGFFKQIEESKIHIINTCDEQGAGYAADAYARLNGLGVVCITYCVGGLKVANTTAEAFAEKSPVIVISGAPGTDERDNDPMLHHKVKTFQTQEQVFKELCYKTFVLDDPATAQGKIDEAIYLAKRYKQPVYIEIPRDVIDKDCPKNDLIQKEALSSDYDILNEGLNEIVSKLNQAKKPAILAGVEIHRFKLEDELLKFANQYQIPVAATILGKSVIAENNPLYMGVYEGGMGHEEVRDYLETSDCLLMLGAYQSDMNLGIFTANLDPQNIVSVSFENLTIQRHRYPNVFLTDVLAGLNQRSDITVSTKQVWPVVKPPHSFVAQDTIMTVARLFQAINSEIDESMCIISDVGDALFGALDLVITKRTLFLSPAYYTSIGFSVPAAVGVQCFDQLKRPLIIVGDGAFQMTGMELSTALRYGLTPIVILLNNGGYGTERPILDGTFNDIFNWNYHKLPDVLGAGVGVKVDKEQSFIEALQLAKKDILW